MSNRYRSFYRGLAIAALCLLASGLYAEESGKDRPWYSAGLEKLGFTVFAKPVVLDDFTVTALDGTSVKLSDKKGKIILLNFWATWCPPCRAEMPAIDALWQKTKDKAFTVMGVSVSEQTGTVKDFIGKQGYGYPIFLDPSGAVGSAFGARSIPTTFILDKSGRAIAGKVGGAPYDEPESLALFADLASR